MRSFWDEEQNLLWHDAHRRQSRQNRSKRWPDRLRVARRRVDEHQAVDDGRILGGERQRQHPAEGLAEDVHRPVWRGAG